MSIRRLKIEEMLAQKEGDEAILLSKIECYPVGTPVRRRSSVRDDGYSVSYNFPDGQWRFVLAGEVGIREVDKHPLIIKTVKEQLERPAEEIRKLFDDLVEKGSAVEVGDDLGVALGVYRPELTTRKAGKIRVELVDDGFPLALREVAKVMTWAQTAKGYKDHDWQNLPDAEIALAAAASRHRTDYIDQRVIQGLPALECVDPESSLVHKAHEAFGVLAQLELLLRAKFVDSRKQIGV